MRLSGVWSSHILSKRDWSWSVHGSHCFCISSNHFISLVIHCIGRAIVPFGLHTLQSVSGSKFWRNFAMSDKYFFTVPDLMDFRAIVWSVARKAA